MIGQVFLWWVVTGIFGWLAWPVGFWLFRRLPGRGYAFSRTLGLFLASYLFWAGCSLHSLQNDSGGILLALLTLAGVSAWLVFRPGGKKDEIRLWILQHRRLIVTSELLFAVCFVGWSALRAFAVGKIMPVGGEKFMEIAFLNGILNSQFFPPLDPWLSGYAISYYYFGYVMMALLTRLTGALPAVAFDLYDALLFALGACGAFGLVYELVSSTDHDRKGTLPAALTGAVFTVTLGNWQGFLEILYTRGWLPFSWAAWLGVPNFPGAAQVTGTFNPGSFWGWGWRASRVLSDSTLSGETIDLNPITEFPAFSFLLGDNHPHVLALPFSLLGAAIAFQVLRMALSREELHPWRGIVTGWIAGGLLFLNTWDYPITLGLILAAWLAGSGLSTGLFSNAALRSTLRLGLICLASGIFFYLPFFSGFSSQAGGILPHLLPPTRLTQYLIMFGPFILVLAGFLSASWAQECLRSGRRVAFRRWLGWWSRLVLALLFLFLVLLALAALILWLDAARGGNLSAALLPILEGRSPAEAAFLAVAYRLRRPGVLLLLTGLLSLAGVSLWEALERGKRAPADEASPLHPPSPDPGLIFARLLAMGGLALTLVVEFFYLRDGFGVRMNTVFKFYFQAWLFMSTASAYGVWWLFRNGHRAVGALPALALKTVALIGILAGMAFPIGGIISRTGGFSAAPSLDAASELRRDHPEDWAAIDWLLTQRADGASPPVLLEAPGKSYTYAGRMSAFTGFPAVLGWAIHEMQWRGAYTEQARREEGTARVFTAPASPEAQQWLRTWQVEYIILGEAEHAYIRERCSRVEQPCNPDQVESEFARLYRPVFQQGQTTVYRLPPRLR